MDHDFKEGDLIEFAQGEHTGCGYVRGISSIAQPFIGTTYIIQVLSTNIVLEYSCIAVFEIFIKRITK
jgi:hypothetical protein